MAEQPSSQPNLLQIVGSALSAAFGVQNRKTLERDFASVSAKTFIIVGIIGTVLFISLILLVVRLVLG